MGNPWYKYKNASKRKKQALHSLIAGLVFFAVLYIITRFFQITLCPIQNLFGFPCFGCGLSRGFLAILSLELKKATQYHVLSIPLFIGIIIYALLCFSDIFLDRNDLERISKFFQKKYMFILYLIILLLSVYLNQIL